jgi:hypothetical protein
VDDVHVLGGDRSAVNHRCTTAHDDELDSRIEQRA